MSKVKNLVGGTGFRYRSGRGFSVSLLDIEKHPCGDPCGNPANLGATCSAVASGLMKGRPLFRDHQTVDLAEPFPMDLRAKRMADFFIKPVVDPAGLFHRFSILFTIVKPLPPDDGANRHDGARQSPACFASSGDPAGQGASGLKNLCASDV